ncbi:hypothetical protein HMPREF2996_00260 [Corynebacterium sp. HMSC066C02]|nr:hypothetical protein HMPREF2996_00260 [Corynebacterium sp. HMSC066C02]
MAYCYEDEGAQWTGTSIFRPAYKHWRLKDELLRKEVTTLDRNGMGFPVYTGSDITDNPKADLEYGQALAENARSGDYAGAAVPAGAKFELKGVSGQLVSPREAISYHDSMIARAVLAHFLNLENGGSYNLAQTQSDLFIQSLQTIAEWFADVFTQHVIEDLVEVAFPDHQGMCPRLVFDPIASRKELGAGDLAQLLNSGALFADPKLEEHLRRSYSLPPKQKLTDALKSKQQRQRLEEQMGVTLSSDSDTASSSEEGGTA